MGGEGNGREGLETVNTDISSENVFSYAGKERKLVLE